MNRVTAAAAALATAAAATTVLATAIVPAMAATRPAAAHPAAHAKAHPGAKRHAADGKTSTGSALSALRHLTSVASEPTQIASELDHGKYVTLVKCSGEVPPVPVKLAQRDIPLTVHGSGSSPAVVAKLSKPHAYKAIYTCTVTVELSSPVPTTVTKKVKKPDPAKRCVVCAKTATLNTGFGGLAGQVAKHHPGAR